MVGKSTKLLASRHRKPGGFSSISNGGRSLKAEHEMWPFHAMTGTQQSTPFFEFRG